MSGSVGFRRYLSNTSWLIAERVIRMATAFVTGIIMARYLKQAGFGLFSYAVSFVALFSALASLGLDAIVVRELVRNEARRDEILGSALGLRLCGWAIMSAIAIAVAGAVSGDRVINAMIIILCGAALFQSFNVIDFHFQARVESRFAAWSQMGAVLCSAASIIVFILLKLPVVYFASAKLVEAIVLSAGLMAAFRITTGPLSAWRFKWECACTLLRHSWPLVLTGVCITVYMHIDQVMIKHMLGTSSLGVYAVAVRLCTTWYFLPMVIVTSLFPAILNAKQRDASLYRRRLQHLYDLMTWLGLAVAVPMSMLAHVLVVTLLGAEFSASASVLVLYIWAGVFVFQGVARSKWLIAENLQIYAFWFAFLAALLNVLLNLALIPVMGLPGAAAATVAAQCCSAIVFPMLFAPTRRSSMALLSAFNLVRVIRDLRAVASPT